MHPVAEVFLAFLRLGLTGFGGPIAHLAHFRREIVARRRWMDDAEFTDTVALCQFLPGPTSSQTGFAVGLRHAGLAGGIAAWTAFTAPSAAALAAAGWTLAESGAIAGAGWLAGLRAYAAAVVANAVLGMARALAPTLGRLALSAAAMAAVLAAARLALPERISGLAQVAAIAAGALVGAIAFRGVTPAAPPVPADDAVRARAFHLRRSASAFALAGVAVLLAGAWMAQGSPPIVAAAGTCARAGSLVFGGGHVVLPLLERPFAAEGWLDREALMSGYGLAQAVPGPLFTFAAYLGAAMQAPSGPLAAATGAALLVVAIFLPGLLLVIAALPEWHRLRARPGLRAALAGANCSVIGILGAALVQDVVPAAASADGGLALAIALFAILGTLEWAGSRAGARPRPWIRHPSLALAIAAAVAGELLLGH